MPMFIEKDPWLEPYASKLAHHWSYIQSYRKRILGTKNIKEFALGHLYYGLHRTDKGWVFREWAPNAERIFLLCDNNGWQDNEDYELIKSAGGVWELKLSKNGIKHGQLYKLHVYWPGGDGHRLPSYATYVVQHEDMRTFDAVVWSPEKAYSWRHKFPESSHERLMIYEAHVGMSGQEEAVSSYKDFTSKILPRIKKAGYNAVQLMAVQEHPYYGSFGYHVSNFFAASSRFGTPDDLKKLVDIAHKLGLKVILDIVHSHAVKNEVEGLSRFDGTLDQYFHSGERGNHKAWDSRTFDYGKPEVAHFLLSNVRFWLDEYRFDGFRFDGVTSMLYHDHGLERAFTSYDTYFEGIDLDAVAYLRLANELAHSVREEVVTIAEDMSAFPGLAANLKEDGIGFDYRLSMGVPDLWIKILKEKRDEDWDLSMLFYELTTHRPEERTISYAESHDQALVGDKTLIFRLIDQNMYWHMQLTDVDTIVERGIALHKMIRLFTASTNGGGYLNFMGNEFGHPEWIDFPREGNEWSYKHARRQWNLADSPDLKYRWLQEFDSAMVTIVKKINDNDFHWVAVDNDRKLVSFIRGGHMFVFNFSPQTSYTDHELPAQAGDYKIVLSSDANIYGGQDRVDTEITYSAIARGVKLYIPARTCFVLKHMSKS